MSTPHPCSHGIRTSCEICSSEECSDRAAPRVKDVVTTLPTSVESNTIIFSSGDEEVFKLTKGFFWYRGEKVEDIHNAYDIFVEWLSNATRRN